VSDLRGCPHHHYVLFRHILIRHTSLRNVLLTQGSSSVACAIRPIPSLHLPSISYCPVCLCMLDKDENKTLHPTPETGIESWGIWGSNGGRGLQVPRAWVRWGERSTKRRTRAISP
jgi:hypothetical protein